MASATAFALVVILAGVVTSPATALAVTSSLSADFADAAWKTNPVSKVTNLLRDMQSQLEKEMAEDEEVFDAMNCWCLTNDKLKTKAIADAEAHLADLAETIEEMTATSSQLTTDIAELKTEIATEETALADATAIRQSDKAEFVADESDSANMVRDLTGAVKALSSQHAQPHVVAPAEALTQVSAVRGSVKQPVAASSYTSQSGKIFGVLGQMKDEMAANLAKARESEVTAVRTFDGLKKSKMEGLSAARQQLKEKTMELAETDETLANSKADERDTSAQLTVDQAFLADLKGRCAAMDKEWADRKAMRADEMTAVSEAIGILADDEAKDLAHKTVGSFVQLATAHSMSRVKATMVRTRVAAFLRGMATRNQHPDLAGLAAMIQQEPAGNGTNTTVFAQLQTTIRKLVANRKEATLEEQKVKDNCTWYLNDNENQMKAEYETKADIDGKISDLNALLEKLNAHLDTAKAEEKSAQLQLLAAGTNRKKENLAFQMSRVDQRATQEILAKALEKLQAFYAKKGATLAQVHAAEVADAKLMHAQAPPPGFKPYKKAGGAGGVVGFLQNIIAESVALEKENMAAEQQAQAAFEDFTQETTNLLKALATSVVEATEQKAQADEELVVAKDQLQTSMTTLYDLTEENKAHHSNCDYVLNGFDSRQAKRKQEIEALQKADEMLSGAVM